MNSIAVVRLSDAILAKIQPNEVKDIIDAVQTAEDREASLVLSGVAYGVEESQGYISGLHHTILGLLRDAVGRLDTVIQKTAPGDALSTLLDARRPLSELLNHQCAIYMDGAARDASQIFGIDEKYIRGEADIEELDRPELTMIGAKVWRNYGGFEGVLGWYAARRKNNLHKLKCPCAPCFRGALLANADMSNEKLYDAMIEEFRGLDEASAQFTIYLVSTIRSLILSTFDPVEETGDPDEVGKANETAQTFLDHLRKNSTGEGGGK